MSYAIVGDSKMYGYKGCLVKALPTSWGKDKAQEALNKMLAQPTQDELRDIETHDNIRLEEIDAVDAWWEDKTLAT